MIKRITFGNRTTEASWLAVAVGALDAPADVRPRRIAVCAVVEELVPDPVHDTVALEWFADADHAERFEAWAAGEGRVVTGGTVVVAEEHVLRGADWLDTRWRDGGERLKHMAIARRAAGLTPTEFSRRWRDHAGAVGATPIPDVAKGCAYTQNHPVARPDGEWPYDAVNEVWFDDLDALRTRIDWLADALGANAGGDDLVGEHSFLAVREVVVS